VPRAYAYNSDAVFATEQQITTHKTKQLAADAFVNDTALMQSIDDYMHLQKLRISGSTVLYAPYLNYFLRSKKNFSHHYGDVIYYALKWCEDFTEFAEKMIAGDMPALASKMFQTNENVADVFLNFMESTNIGKRELSIKVSRLMSVIANIAFDGNKASPVEKKSRFFEAAMRTSHKYLQMVYRPDVYCAESVASLPDSESFIYYAGTAFERKDAGDTLGYVRNLLTSVRINPHVGDVIGFLAGKVTEKMNLKK
jgi:hypothetical protein